MTKETKIYAELNQNVWKIYDLENNFIESFRTRLIAEERIKDLNKFREEYKLIRDNSIRERIREKLNKSLKNHRQGNKKILNSPFKPSSFLADVLKRTKK